jgi:hypothetical protein
MPRFERGDIVEVKGFAGHCVVESYLQPDNGPPIVQIWYDKTLVQFIGRDLDKLNLIRESSFENQYLRGKNKGPK